MQKDSSSLDEMVSHCQTPTFTDFSSLSLSMFGGKAELCSRRSASAALIYRSPLSSPARMNSSSPKHLSGSEDKVHQSCKTSRTCFSSTQLQEYNSYTRQFKVLHTKPVKTREWLVLDHLRSTVSSVMDPLQFAYRPGIGVEDAVISLLHRSLSHLEKPGSAVRILFFYLSSAFNTIQLLLLRDKLETAGVDYDLAEWILDYLTNQPLCV